MSRVLVYDRAEQTLIIRKSGRFRDPNRSDPFVGPTVQIKTIFLFFSCFPRGEP